MNKLDKLQEEHDSQLPDDGLCLRCETGEYYCEYCLDISADLNHDKIQAIEGY